MKRYISNRALFHRPWYRREAVCVPAVTPLELAPLTLSWPSRREGDPVVVVTVNGERITGAIQKIYGNPETVMVRLRAVQGEGQG